MCSSPDCGNLDLSDANDPDVYLGRTGQKFQNLCDDMGRPIEIRSKRHKKQVMDKLGVSEAGDRVNGAFPTPKNWIEGSRDFRKRNFASERPKIRETYQRYLDNVKRNKQ